MALFQWQQTRTAPREAWLALCRDVTQLHRLIRENTMFVVCELSGNTPLRYDDSMVGLGVIVFNGDRSNNLAGDAFVLDSLPPPSGSRRCDTRGHPYGFLVQASLLLAAYHCPGVWRVTSDVTPEEWQQTAAWLTTQLNLASRLPDLPF
ncbi:hypothetical protein ACI8CA_001696 [Salmonella enterica]|uniref:hypothetical protein n=1 Tax=Salmonella enterica TaxID=28901 RepID=UPI000BE2634F|nr:hypothetical protein [Salmonella enterica]HBL9992876.1 hypothetical protein [Salmonella enterica subsp. enterica serovar Hidalgo]ATI88095.1 hypothetical protein CGA24_25985 [Salmonella enterica subsp. enterica]EBP2452302.1 hypothetical protein [Salmonella enterica]EDT6572646.1 hypothetical protein [Salmonella enterica subsp. enterica]EHK9168246.1 hypothetical protein [Salmonella enterica]